jgi:hypothetical protein
VTGGPLPSSKFMDGNLPIVMFTIRCGWRSDGSAHGTAPGAHVGVCGSF